MRISAVICEYNPFHNGHLYQINKMRQNGATHIVCIMSGDFVQRGEPAMLPKYLRAKAALLSGADLVLELPLCYALTGADNFAYGGVALASELDCVNDLAFGAECDDLNMLKDIAEIISGDKLSPFISQHMSTGMTFAVARCKAFEDIGLSHYADVLKSPNNILAISYLSHLKNTDIEPMVILRKGVSHDSLTVEKNSASASFIRKHRQSEEAKNAVPENVFPLYKNAYENGDYFELDRNFSTAVLSRLRTMGVEDFKKLPDVSEGLEYKLVDAIKKSTDIQDLYENIKSKRYTLARVRRLVMCAFLGIESAYAFNKPEYCKILAINNKGSEVLALTKNSPLTISHSPQKLLANLPHLSKQLKTEANATDLYNLLLKTPRLPSGASGEKIYKL